MIHHISLGTNDLARSKRFYDAVLPIVGILPMTEDAGGLGYGSGTFHFSVQVPIDGKPATVGNGTHIAFAAEDRAMVDRFHAAALANGGSDDGARAAAGLRRPLLRRLRARSGWAQDREDDLLREVGLTTGRGKLEDTGSLPSQV